MAQRLIIVDLQAFHLKRKGESPREPSGVFVFAFVHRTARAVPLQLGWLPVKRVLLNTRFRLSPEWSHSTKL
jgi:hypothetical protein